MMGKKNAETNFGREKKRKVDIKGEQKDAST